MNSKLAAYLEDELEKILAEEKDAIQTIDPQEVYDVRSLLRGIGMSKSDLPAKWLRDVPDGSVVSCHVRKRHQMYRVEATRRKLKGIGSHYEVTAVEEVQPSKPFNPFDTNTGNRTVTIFRDLLGW